MFVYRNRSEPSKTLHCGKFIIGEETGQNLSITTKSFLPHNSLSILSVGVPAHVRILPPLRCRGSNGCRPSDVRACTPHASLGQPRHDASHGAVIAQEQLLLTPAIL